jgi:type III secretion system FlhB-like substrate exporter
MNNTTTSTDNTDDMTGEHVVMRTVNNPLHASSVSPTTTDNTVDMTDEPADETKLQKFYNNNNPLDQISKEITSNKTTIANNVEKIEDVKKKQNETAELYNQINTRIDELNSKIPNELYSTISGIYERINVIDTQIKECCNQILSPIPTFKASASVTNDNLNARDNDIKSGSTDPPSKRFKSNESLNPNESNKSNKSFGTGDTSRESKKRRNSKGGKRKTRRQRRRRKTYKKSQNKKRKSRRNKHRTNRRK